MAARRRVGGTGAAPVVALAVATVAAATVFPPDSRSKVLDTTASPYRRVYHGSGFLTAGA